MKCTEDTDICFVNRQDLCNSSYWEADAKDPLLMFSYTN